MNRAGILFMVLPVICLADAGVLDYVEPILNTPVVATSVGYVVGVLEEQGWSLVEATGEKVTAARTTDGGEERLSFEFSEADVTTLTELHQDIVQIDYSYTPWLEYGVDVDRWKGMFEELVAAFDYLIGPGVTETSDTGIVHTWPGRDSSLIELLLEPVWETRLTVSVELVPLREPEDD